MCACITSASASKLAVQRGQQSQFYELTSSSQWGFFVPVVTMTSDYSAYLLPEGNDRSAPLLKHLYPFPPACTSRHVRSQLAFQQDATLASNHSLFPPSFLSMSPITAGEVKTFLKKVERRKDKSQEFNKAHLNTAKWLMNLHTGTHSVQVTAVF